jgi:hypothetical protein
MAYTVPSLIDLQNFLIALAKALLPDRNIGARSGLYRKLIKVMAGGVTDIHAHLATVVKDVMPDTATKGALDRWLAIYGLIRKGATPARKSKAGRVRGTVAATSAIGDQLIHRSSGLLFQINSSVTIPAAGYFDADIVAVDKGAQTRLEAGEILEYLSPPVGIQTQVVLKLALDTDGYDNEQDGAAQVRLLATIGQPASGGNQTDYVGWCLAQTGISAAFCYPNRAGVGSVDVAALHSGSGTTRVLSAPEVAALLLTLQGLAPAQLYNGALRVLTVTTTTQNVELTITPDGTPSYAFDWDDSTGPYTVQTWTPATRTLQFAGGALPATMVAGDRICFGGVASAQDGTQYVVESIAGADTVVLAVAPPVAPAATDLVYSGGPLTDTIRNAIVAHLNGDVLYADTAGPLPGLSASSTIGLNVLAQGMGTANPAGAYGSWTGGVMRGTLSKIAMYTKGVRNHAIVTPATDVEATDYAFPIDSQIGLLIPGSVLVRRG